VQHDGLAGAVAADLNTGVVEQRQALGGQLAQAGIGRRDQKTLRQLDADVAGRGVHITAREQFAADAADFRPGFVFGEIKGRGVAHGNPMEEWKHAAPARRCVFEPEKRETGVRPRRLRMPS